jgi:CRP-like cAMP-binding protein
MFFVTKGTCSIFSREGAFLVSKRRGDYFGEVALVLKDSERTATVCAKTYCILAMLDKRKFVSIMTTDPKQMERILQRIRSFHVIDGESEGSDDDSSSSSKQMSSKYVPAADRRESTASLTAGDGV